MLPDLRANPHGELAHSVGIQRMRREDNHADQGENRYRELDHRSASCSPIVARNLFRDWFQMKSKMSCMSAVPVLLPTRYAAHCFRTFSSFRKNGFVRTSFVTE